MIDKILKKAFDPYYEAPLQVWTNLANLCEEVQCKKNEVIKEAHTTARYGYFLLEGSVGTFVWKKNSLACLHLFLENSFFADDLSLTTGQPSPLEIKSLEASSLLRISKANMDVLKKTAIGSQLFLAGESNDYAKQQSQQIELMTKTAEERYVDIMNDQPELLDRIPQKYIASYLGITTQSLSRIRRNITR